MHADFHQGNELMCGSKAGKQCVAMSLCSIIYNENNSVNIWNTTIILEHKQIIFGTKQILAYGSNLNSIISLFVLS